MTTRTPASQGEPVIRRVERADLLAIFRIEQEAFPQPWPFDAFESHLGSDGFLVAVADGIVGYVVADTVTSHGRQIGHIKDIAVARTARSRGVGSQLLRRALGVLRAKGLDSVKLEVRESNETARNLYRTFGFEHRRTLPHYYSDGEPALVLVTEL